MRPGPDRERSPGRLSRTLPGSRHGHFSYSCCIFLPQEHLNYLKRAWEGGPTVIHLCALDDSASCCFAGGVFSFLGSPVKPDIIEKRVCSEKARDAQSEIPSSGSEIRQDGSSLGSGLHLFSSGNILNNSSTTAQAGNVIGATPRPYADLVRFPCTQWSVCIQFWAPHITYVGVCDHHCQDGEQLSKASLPLLLF